MPKQTQAAESKQHQTRKAQTEAARQAEGEPVSPEALAAGPMAAAGGGAIEEQAAVLGRRQWQNAQRQAIAAQIGRRQGNRHLQRLGALLNHDRPAASAPVIQRQGPAAGGGSGAVGAIDKGKAQQARAQRILATTYGAIKPVIPFKVEALDDATLKVKFVELQIREKRTNPKTQEPWKPEDAQMLGRLDGFADHDLQTIYILDDPGAEGDDQTPVVVHEMLHLNAASGFAGTMGADIDEGATEYLTIKACAQAGVAIKKAAYGGQVSLVNLLVQIVGEGTLIQAYFNSPNVLITTLDTVRGEGAFKNLRKRLGSVEDGLSKAEAFLKAPRSPDWVKEKIKVINDLLDGWVSDNDLEAIRTVFGTVESPEDKQAIREAIAPRVTELVDHGQRARLRLILGL
jgi:hypothetical protein